jgi:hypothetical protein
MSDKQTKSEVEWLREQYVDVRRSETITKELLVSEKATTERMQREIKKLERTISWNYFVHVLSAITIAGWITYIL